MKGDIFSELLIKIQRLYKIYNKWKACVSNKRGRRSDTCAFRILIKFEFHEVLIP